MTLSCSDTQTQDTVSGRIDVKLSYLPDFNAASMTVFFHDVIFSLQYRRQKLLTNNEKYGKKHATVQ